MKEVRYSNKLTFKRQLDHAWKKHQNHIFTLLARPLPLFPNKSRQSFRSIKLPFQTKYNNRTLVQRIMYQSSRRSQYSLSNQPGSFRKQRSFVDKQRIVEENVRLKDRLKKLKSPYSWKALQEHCDKHENFHNLRRTHLQKNKKLFCTNVNFQNKNSPNKIKKYFKVDHSTRSFLRQMEDGQLIHILQKRVKDSIRFIVFSSQKNKQSFVTSMPIVQYDKILIEKFQNDPHNLVQAINFDSRGDLVLSMNQPIISHPHRLLFEKVVESPSREERSVRLLEQSKKVKGVGYEQMKLILEQRLKSGLKQQQMQELQQVSEESQIQVELS